MTPFTSAYQRQLDLDSVERDALAIIMGAEIDAIETQLARMEATADKALTAGGLEVSTRAIQTVADLCDQIVSKLRPRLQRLQQQFPQGEGR